MKILERKIDDNYMIFCQKNTMERENASSVKKTIIATFSAVAGAVGSFFVGGPMGLRLFLQAVGSGSVGGGIGAAINAILPSRWTNSESSVGRTIRFLTSNLNQLLDFLHPRNRAIANETRLPNNNTTTPTNATSTAGNATNIGNDPVSRIWNEAKSTVSRVINSILHYRFRRN